MSSPKNLHIKATQLMSKARIALDDGKKKEFLILLNEAFEVEKAAANLLYAHTNAEPTRSVLFRSAASLAIQCGKISEAERLVYAGLSGNPAPDLESELLILLEDFVHNPLLIQEKQVEEEGLYYLVQLREEALNFRVQPTKHTYSHAIAVENVITFLQNVRSSWDNFLIVNFKKSFGEKFKEDANSLASKLTKELPLLSVNQKFASFGVSISCDTSIMTRQHYSSEIKDWRKGIFDIYKSEIFIKDLDDQEHLDFLKDKYSDEERVIIFRKIVDSLKEENGFKVSLTNRSYTAIEKKFKPLNKNIRIQLVPKITHPSKPDEKIVVRQFAMVDPSTGKLKQGDIFEQSVMQSGKWDYPTDYIALGKEYINLREKIILQIEYEMPVFSISLTEINVQVTADTYDGVKESFNKEFIRTYDILFNKNDNNLSVDERASKEYLSNIVFFRSQK